MIFDSSFIDILAALVENVFIFSPIHYTIFMPGLNLSNVKPGKIHIPGIIDFLLQEV
jgi:hypothetical protein